MVAETPPTASIYANTHVIYSSLLIKINEQLLMKMEVIVTVVVICYAAAGYIWLSAIPWGIGC